MNHPLPAGVTAAANFFAADAPKLPSIPAEPIAKKKELLFSDDFERAELGKAWAIVVPTYSLENGMLKGTQMRFDAPAVEFGRVLLRRHPNFRGRRRCGTGPKSPWVAVLSYSAPHLLRPL